MSEPYEPDYEGKSDRTEGLRILNRRRFRYDGEDMEEIEWIGKHGEISIGWTKFPFADAVVNGRPNPIIHSNYLAEDEAGRLEALQAVKNLWDHSTAS